MNERRIVRSLVGLVAVLALPSVARADVKACLDAAEDGQKARDSGTYRQARERFIECAADECPGEVRKACVGWLGELDKLIPTVVFGARAHGKEVAEVRVTVDGEVVAERIEGKPIALDPGEHHFRFERTGETATEETSVLLAGEKERHVNIRFGAEPSVLAPPPLSATPTQANPPQAQSTRTAAYVLGAFGLASLAAGAILDASGYAFLQQCGGDPSCTGMHERAEVEWRFVTGDALLGAAVLSGVAAWLLWSHDSRGAKSPVTLNGFRRFGPCTTFGLFF